MKFFFVFGSAVMLALTACSPQTNRVNAPPVASSTPASPSEPTDTFETGLDKASKAAYTSKNAETKEDWDLASNRWQQAVDLMKAVPKTSSNYTKAQEKIVEYQRSLDLAEKRASNTVSVSESSPPTESKLNKKPGTPLEDFFESYMNATINRGSSGSEYWCSQSKQFESSFFAPRSYKLLNTHTAPSGAGGSIVFQLDSSNKGGAQITSNWVIVIEKEKNKKLVNNRPGGWCVSMLWDK